MLRYIIRHPGMMTTPRTLAEALGCKTRRWPTSRNFTPSYTRDFIFNMPHPSELREAETDIHIAQKAGVVHEFFWKNKLEQRRALFASGLPIPWTLGVSTTPQPEGEFVRRPLRHSGGADYALTQTPEQSTGHYVSAIFPKSREYRVVFVYGEPLVFLRKRVPDGTGNNLPWNHSVGGTFTTINDVGSSMPSRCGAIDLLKTNPVVRAAHIVGVDLLWRISSGQPEWCVLEFNSAPALTIDNNVQKIADFIKERHI
jgi:hypothetical protein